MGGKEILKGIDLAVGTGEVHAVMGPNGSGRARSRASWPGAAPRSPRVGDVRGPRPAGSHPEERAREGLFLAFQYPVELPGVNNAYFLRAALNAVRKHRGEPELDAIGSMALIRDKMALLASTRR